LWCFLGAVWTTTGGAGDNDTGAGDGWAGSDIRELLGVFLLATALHSEGDSVGRGEKQLVSKVSEVVEDEGEVGAVGVGGRFGEVYTPGRGGLFVEETEVLKASRS